MLAIVTLCISDLKWKKIAMMSSSEIQVDRDEDAKTGAAPLLPPQEQRVLRQSRWEGQRVRCTDHCYMTVHSFVDVCLPIFFNIPNISLLLLEPRCAARPEQWIRFVALRSGLCHARIHTPLHRTPPYWGGVEIVAFSFPRHTSRAFRNHEQSRCEALCQSTSFFHLA